LLETLAAQGADGFGIFPGDAVGINSTLAEFKTNNIPTIAIAGCTQDPTPAAFCFSTDVYQAAYVGTKALIDAMGGKGAIVHMAGLLVDPNTTLREQAVQKAVDETNGAVTLLQTVGDTDDQEKRDQKIHALLAAQKDKIGGIIATAYTSSVVTASAPRTTWKFVSTYPRLSTMTPEPSPGVWNSSRRPGPLRPKNWSKKSLKKGSSAFGPGIMGGRRPRATWSVPMWTTAGRTRSATLTKAAWRASAVAIGAGVVARAAPAARVNMAYRANPAPAKAKRIEAARAARTVCAFIVVFFAIPSRNYGKTYEKVYPFPLTPIERKSENVSLDANCPAKS